MQRTNCGRDACYRHVSVSHRKPSHYHRIQLIQFPNKKSYLHYTSPSDLHYNSRTYLYNSISPNLNYIIVDFEISSSFLERTCCSSHYWYWRWTNRRQMAYWAERVVLRAIQPQQSSPSRAKCLVHPWSSEYPQGGRHGHPPFPAELGSSRR